jgi:hypothetical protein
VRTPFLAVLRCEAVVMRRRLYRVIAGRPDYAHQCLRRHAKGSRFCWQHARAEGAKA